MNKAYLKVNDHEVSMTQVGRSNKYTVIATLKGKPISENTLPKEKAHEMWNVFVKTALEANLFSYSELK